MTAAVSIFVNMANRLFPIVTLFVMLLGVEASDVGSDASSTPPIKRVVLPGLENSFALSTNVFSGGTPEGDHGFASLKKLGIKTIITVDGAQPDLTRAYAQGMRYIHLPHGYDGISQETQLQLIKAGQIAEGPIYIHCHHGKHRGPAAAAVICMANNAWSTNDALLWLKAAGTGTNYQGLFEVVRSFKKPAPASIDAVSSNFPETQKVSGLVDSMVLIDQTFDRLKTLRVVASPTAPGVPDNHLLNEATLLREQFREALRLPDSQKKGADFMKALAAAEDLANAFEEVVGSSADRAALDRAFEQLTKSCASCHRAHRDTSSL